jgi:hypothetical protein
MRQQEDTSREVGFSSLVRDGRVFVTAVKAAWFRVGRIGTGPLEKARRRQSFRWLLTTHVIDWRDWPGFAL